MLQKFQGKGGWTYVSIPEIKQDKYAWFGWMKVRGSIDESEISKINLMQNENGTLILPVKVFVITVKEFAFEFLF
ncbi:MAG: DUF1905 domain-containing protein [Paludibacter sp.]|nr:DUF1905 domain-containing protein [Paludibacter sp.]